MNFINVKKSTISCANFSSPLRNKSCSEMKIRMKINEYQELTMTTLNPELSKRDVLINSVMGLCGESGEAFDIVKNGWLKDMNWTRNILQNTYKLPTYNYI